MLPRALLRSSWRFYVRNPWQALLALVSVALGAAVVVAVGLANQSALEAFDQAITDLNPAATHRLLPRGDALDDGVLVQARTQWGVSTAWPELAQHGRVESATASLPVTLHAAMPLLQALPGRGSADQPLSPDLLGRWLRGEPVIALSQTVATQLKVEVGDPLSWIGPLGTETLEVAMLFDAPGLREVALADIAMVQRLANRPGELDAVAMQLSDNTASALRERLPEGVVLEAMARSRAQFDAMTRAFRISVRAMSLLTVMVGAFLVYNTLTFLVLRRRATLGAARLIGTTRPQLFALLLIEAVSLGLAGALLGMLFGVVLAHAMLGLLERVFVDIYSGDAPSALVLDVGQFAVAGATTLAAVLLAALGPAREAALTTPNHLLVERDLASTRSGGLRIAALIGVGLSVAGAGVLAAFDGILSAYLGLFLLVVGYGAVMPIALRGLFDCLQPAVRRRSVSVRLVVSTVRQSLSRTALAVAALTLALAAAVGIGSMVNAFRQSVDVWLHQTLSSDVYVSAVTQDGARALDAADFEALRALPGVRSVSAGRRESARVDGQPTSAFVIRVAAHTRAGFPLRQAIDAAAWSRFSEGRGVIVSEPLARRLQLSLGQSVDVVWPEGQIVAPVIGVFRDYSSSQGVVALSEPLARRGGDTRDFLSAGISLETGDDAAPVLERVRAFAAARPTPYAVTDSATIRADSLAVFDRTFAVTGVIKVLVTLVALLGVFGALMAVLLERRTDFSVLRALGLSPRQLRALLFGLAAVLGGLAAAFAVPLGALLAWLLTDIVNTRAFGWSIDPLLDWRSFASVLVLGPAAAMAAAWWPARRADAVSLNAVTRL